MFTLLKNVLGKRRANKPGFYKKPGLFALVVFLFLTGCSPQVTGIASPTKTEFVLDATHTLGQTFTAHHAGLNGIEVFLAPNTNNTGSITLSLKASPAAPAVLATAQLNASMVQAPAYYRFNFVPLADSRNTDYFVEIATQGQTKLQVGSAAGDVYMDGALYQNGEAQEAQLAFRLVYDRAGMVVGFIRQLGEWVKVLLATLVIVILPGLSLLASWRGWQELSWLERLSLACGIGLALIPLLLVWAQLLSAVLSTVVIALISIACIALQFWLLLRAHRKRKSDLIGFPKPVRSKTAQLCALLVLLLIIVTRFQAIGSLEIPMWGDSVHHTLITQLIVDHNGLFDSWQPYAELSSFTYHFGFHGFAAALGILTGMAAPQATLWAGQVCNILAVFALYALAIKLSGNGNAWAGVVALLVAGLLSPMPMYYVNWGRYTQLAGQVILCAAIYLLWWMAEARTNTMGAALLLALALAGLALTHYRVLAFALVFAVVCVLVVLLAYMRERRASNLVAPLRQLFASAILCGAFALVLFSPWLVHVSNSLLASIFGTFMRTAPKNLPESVSAVNNVGSLFLFQDATLWCLLALGCVLGAVQNQRAVLSIMGWAALIFIITNPSWLGLPGTGIVSNFATLIAIYIPTALILGLVASKLLDQINTSHALNLFSKRLASIAFALVLGASGLQGAITRMVDVQLNAGILVTHPDLRAATWIRANLPNSAYLLVNMFAAYSGTVSVGTDGGWWLPLLAGVRTTLPPVTYVFEQPTRPELKAEVARFTKLATASDVSQATWAASIKSLGITHIFVGQRQGRVNYSGHNLYPQYLVANPGLRMVYHEDRIYIFQIK